MKLKFNFVALLACIGSSFLIVNEMVKAGVPDAIIYTFAFLYGILFPWRYVTVEEPTEGESEDDTKP